MKASKIQIGAKVNGRNGTGIITKIITKSTGYVEVTYSDCVKKEMAFNLTDENGESMKSKPGSKPMTDARHSRFMSELNDSVLRDNFTDNQIESGSYNVNLIR